MGDGGRADADDGGRAGAVGSGGRAGAVGSGGGGTSGGAAVTCPTDCASDAECSVAGGVATCNCRSGFIGDGEVCAPPTSCNQLHLAEPQLPSGAYLIQPGAADTPFMAYCEMAAEAGGWTLALNAGTSFDQTTNGVPDVQCYREDCTSLAYSTVPVDADLMLDVRNGRLIADNQLARIVIKGVAAATRGRTLRNLINAGPSYLETEDNTNLAVRLSGAESCDQTLPADMAALVCTSCMAGTPCDAPVLVLGDDDPGCVDTPASFAVGGAYSYTAAWNNCAGWPQSSTVGGIQYYPENFRIWVR